MSMRRRAHAANGDGEKIVGKHTAGWHRFAGYLRLKGDDTMLTGVDHTAIVAAVESIGAEVHDFRLYDVGDKLQPDHAHALIDHDLYAAMLGVIKEAEGFFKDGLTMEDRIARVYTTRKALDRYREAQYDSDRYPPHPQIEGPGWRHY